MHSRISTILRDWFIGRTKPFREIERSRHLECLGHLGLPFRRGDRDVALLESGTTAANGLFFNGSSKIYPMKVGVNLPTKTLESISFEQQERAKDPSHG